MIATLHPTMLLMFLKVLGSTETAVNVSRVTMTAWVAKLSQTARKVSHLAQKKKTRRTIAQQACLSHKNSRVTLSPPAQREGN